MKSFTKCFCIWTKFQQCNNSIVNELKSWRKVLHSLVCVNKFCTISNKQLSLFSQLVLIDDVLVCMVYVVEAVI